MCKEEYGIKFAKYAESRSLEKLYLYCIVHRISSGGAGQLPHGRDGTCFSVDGITWPREQETSVHVLANLIPKCEERFLGALYGCHEQD